jgi:monoterpene epsilon-lactone hydrolase
MGRARRIQRAGYTVASWQAKFMSGLLRVLFKPRLRRATDIASIRKVMTMPPVRPARGTRVAPAQVGGVQGEWIIADGVSARGTLLYLHGGGYMACNPPMYRNLTCAFALAGFRTFVPDYRLAPEHPFPAGLEDAIGAYRGLLKDHDPRQIVVAGDSAGGGLSAALLISLRDQRLPMAAAAALLSPFVDLMATGATVQSNATRCAMFSPEMFDRAARFYVGERDLRMPLASPLYADLRGLPPLMIHAGEDETLLDDSRRFAEHARQAGVEVELKVWPAVPHVFQLFQRWIPESRASLQEIADFLAARAAAAGEPSIAKVKAAR